MSRRTHFILPELFLEMGRRHGAAPVRGLGTALAAAFLVSGASASGSAQGPGLPVLPSVDPPGPQVVNRYGASPQVVVPLVFPVLGKNMSWSDSFGAPRDGGRRKHHGQDLMAPKMTPLLAAFAGTVQFQRTDGANAHNMLWLRGDQGWTAAYMHINNDTPGTDDGQGSGEYAFAPGLQPGDRVLAGQFLGWVGDSGNAEETGPHLHFELEGPDGVVNAAPSLRHATHLPEPAVSLPGPEFKPAPEETRIDGILRRVDLDRELLCLDLIALQPHAKKVQVATAPARRWVSFHGIKLSPTDSSAPELSLDQLPLGSWVTAVVRYQGPAKAAPALRITHQPVGGPPSPERIAAGSGAPSPGPQVSPEKADTWVPFVSPGRPLRTLAGADPPGVAPNRTTLSGGWDARYLYLTLESGESFRARLELQSQILRLDEGGLRYEGGPQAGESAPGAVIASRNAPGRLTLRVLLPLKLVLPGGMEEPGPDAEPVVRLRLVAELSSGAEVSLPEAKRECSIRLSRTKASE